jgi:hypothetical protein
LNRIGIIATFTALDELYEAGAHDGVRRVIKEVLREAKRKSKEDSFDTDERKAAD